MPEKCGKCKCDFSSGDFTAKCSDCSLSFHPACTRLGSAQNLTKNKLKLWKCDNCDSATATPSETVTVDNTTFFEAINSLKLDINSNTDTKISVVMDSINSMRDDFQRLESKFSALESKQSDLERRCDQLELDKKELGAEVYELRQQLRDTEQHSRSANIEIVGLPQTPEENIYLVLESIAKLIEVPYTRGDVSLAHRLRLYSKKHSHPPAIVQFVSRSVREQWIYAAKRKRGFKASDLASSLPPTMVYVNEQLTAHNKALLGRARRLQKEGKLYYAGFNNGKVLVRPSEKDASTRVLDLQDLDRFEK